MPQALGLTALPPGVTCWVPEPGSSEPRVTAGFPPNLTHTPGHLPVFLVGISHNQIPGAPARQMHRQEAPF